MSRKDRKNDHLFLSMHREDRRMAFSDISFVNNCLPDLDLQDIKLNSSYLGRTHRSPLFINAITGGTSLAKRVNGALAAVAREFSIPMAVGSQMAALENKKVRSSYSIVRKVNPDGEIWANIGSYAEPTMVKQAVEMIGADAVQIHLNTPQEIAMKSGDCNFKGLAERIKEIIATSEVPVIIKEVGFGISGKEAKVIMNLGASAIDVGGKGGTNFIAIEQARSSTGFSRRFTEWGILTPISLIEVLERTGGKINIFASGGINNGTDAALALALGADAVGMAGLPVYLIMKFGPQVLLRKLKFIEKELKAIMLMAGASDIEDLKKIPLVITGYTAEWLQRREIDPSKYANRGE